MEEPQSEENEEQGGVDEEEFPHDAAARAEGGQWQLATGLEDRRLPPPLGYQGIQGQVRLEKAIGVHQLEAEHSRVFFRDPLHAERSFSGEVSFAKEMKGSCLVLV